MSEELRKATLSRPTVLGTPRLESVALNTETLIRSRRVLRRDPLPPGLLITFTCIPSEGGMEKWYIIRRVILFRSCRQSLILQVVSQGPTSLYHSPPATRQDQYRSVHAQDNASDGRREAHNSATQMPRSVVGLNEGMARPMGPLQRAERSPVRNLTTSISSSSTHIPSTGTRPGTNTVAPMNN